MQFLQNKKKNSDIILCQCLLHNLHFVVSDFSVNECLVFIWFVLHGNQGQIQNNAATATSLD